MTDLIDGRGLAKRLRDSLSDRVESLPRSPSLHVLTGISDEATRSYLRQKSTQAEQVGIDVEVHDLSEQPERNRFVGLIEELNDAGEVDGIIIQLPLPEGLEEFEILETVRPDKDVDGLHPFNFGRLLGDTEPLFIPPTPKGIIQLLREYEVEIAGAEAVVVGMGRLVGRPLSQCLLNNKATVSCLHEQTRDLAVHTREADIVVAAAGTPRLLGDAHIGSGTVVLDAGIHRENGELFGDVDFETVADRTRLITPVPGGVGPMTVACLLQNTVRSAIRRTEPN